jgi:hypothetical protein
LKFAPCKLQQIRLYKKAESEKFRLDYLCHALMENRNSLVVDVEMTAATGTAEREADKAMVCPER